MTQQAFEQGNWQAVIAAHPLESHDPQEWLRYGVALLQTIEPGTDVGKQQQQALAFVQAQKEGATAQEVEAAQRQSVLLSLREALEIAGVPKKKKKKPVVRHIQLLHLHGFKCAGSTFIWSLERATQGQLAYFESESTESKAALAAHSRAFIFM